MTLDLIVGVPGDGLLFITHCLLWPVFCITYTNKSLWVKYCFRTRATWKHTHRDWSCHNTSH